MPFLGDCCFSFCRIVLASPIFMLMMAWYASMQLASKLKSARAGKRQISNNRTTGRHFLIIAPKILKTFYWDVYSSARFLLKITPLMKGVFYPGFLDLPFI